MTGPPPKSRKTILLTFDVEDWFQVENFKDYIPFSSWDSKELRVEKNVNNLLDLLDSFAKPIRATLFVLGWIAERCPELVQEIQKRGHEVASHGYDHNLCYKQPLEALQDDLLRSKELSQDQTGIEVVSYRAPSFSIIDETIKGVRDAGYLYDSSYNSYAGHGRYGSLTIPHPQQDLICYKIAESFFEIPVSNLNIGSRIIPWGGGGYFRLLPSLVHRRGVQKILQQTGCFTFYMHPWEIDPEQPRVKEAKLFFRFRHYVNLQNAKYKLKKMIAANMDCPFITCKELVDQRI